MAPSLRQKLSWRPRLCPCPRAFAGRQGHNSPSHSLSHDKEQYFTNNDRYASMEDIAKLANELSQLACPPAEVDDFADIILRREDFQDADFDTKIDIYIFLMEYGGLFSIENAADFAASDLEKMVERSGERLISSTCVSLPQAARLFAVSSKLISTLMKELNQSESIVDLCQVRHYSFEGVKDYICLELSNPMVSDEELVPLVDALKVILKASYLNLSHENIKRYIYEDGDAHHLEYYRRVNADFQMYRRGYTSFWNRISKAIVAEVKNTPLFTPETRKRMLAVVGCLIKEAGMVALEPVEKQIEKRIRQHGDSQWEDLVRMMEELN
jgi:hypothetical protein